MVLYINYDVGMVCRKVLQEQLDRLNLEYSIKGFGELEIKETLSEAKLEQLNAGFNSYGIRIVEDQKSVLVQKIKSVLLEMIYSDEKLPSSKVSNYLVEKLNHSYGYISNLFSAVTYTSIENFIILQRIERAKQLITAGELSLTQICWKLQYSSTAHFSNQFKNVTGLTPTAFQRIITKRREIVMSKE